MEFEEFDVQLLTFEHNHTFNFFFLYLYSYDYSTSKWAEALNVENVCSIKSHFVCQPLFELIKSRWKGHITEKNLSAFAVALRSEMISTAVLLPMSAIRSTSSNRSRATDTHTHTCAHVKYMT